MKALFIGPDGPMVEFVRMVLYVVNRHGGPHFELQTVSQLLNIPFTDRPSNDAVKALNDIAGSAFDVVIIPDRSGDGAFWANAVHEDSPNHFVVYWTAKMVNIGSYPAGTHFASQGDLPSVILGLFK